MTGSEFVRIVESFVAQNAFKTTTNLLERPPGRKPLSKYVKRSKWYNSLDTLEREIVNDVIRMSIDSAVFRILNLIDGTAGRINDANGYLLLIMTDENGSYIINSKEHEPLHEDYSYLEDSDDLRQSL